jgi:choline-glycine betaine transporter
LFTALDALPFPIISSALCVILIALFFISGADAAAIVMATMATRGSLEPGRLVVIVLGALMGAIACAMLLVGGLTGLQQAAVLGAVPFTFVVIGVAWCWLKALREETREQAGASARLARAQPPVDVPARSGGPRDPNVERGSDDTGAAP